MSPFVILAVSPPEQWIIHIKNINNSLLIFKILEVTFYTLHFDLEKLK